MIKFLKNTFLLFLQFFPKSRLEMYSDLFFNQIHLMVKACSTVGSFSAHFDTKGRFFYSTEKSRRKFHITIVIMSGYVAFLWIQTYKVWVYHGGEKNLHFHTAYGFSGILFMCVGILVSLLQNHDNVINGTNHILNYFPYFRSKYLVDLISLLGSIPKCLCTLRNLLLK